MNCSNCGAINSVVPIGTQDSDNFMLIAVPSNGNFNLPPNGLVVKALGCTKCGYVHLGSKELVSQKISQ